MNHPLQSLSPAQRRTAFWILLPATIVLIVIMNGIGAPLITPAAPYGIISFEFAGTLENAQAILQSWDADAQLHAAFSLGLDYLFMLAYSTAIGLACILAGSVLHSKGLPLAGMAAWLAWAMWLAGGQLRKHRLVR